MLLLSLLTVAHAECPATYAQVTAHIDGALDAYDDGLYEPFQDHTRALRADVACLQAMLEPADALALHLVSLYEAWGRKDEAATVAAFHAVLDLDPGFVIETEVKLSDKALQAVLEGATASHAPAETAPLPLVSWSTWHLNGSPAAGQAPTGRPVLVQLLNGQTYQVRTWWLPEGGVPEELASKAAASRFEWGPAPEPPGSGDEAASDPVPVSDTDLATARPVPPSDRRLAPVLFKLGGAGLVVAGGVVAGVGLNAQLGPVVGEGIVDPDTVWYKDVDDGRTCVDDDIQTNDRSCAHGYYWRYLFPMYVTGGALAAVGVVSFTKGTLMVRRTVGGWGLVWERRF